MTHHDDLEEALDELAAQKRALAAARSDYARIIRSRFHALRLAWLALKSAAGFGSQRDEYAAWSPSAEEVFHSAPALAPIVVTSAQPLDDAGERFIESWDARCGAALGGAEPVVSIIIPVFNQLETTARCLDSIAACGFDGLSVQMIVVDDGSTDATNAIVPRLGGVEYVRGANGGFIAACNRGAALARGDFLCFLNNDTTVRPGWLGAMVATARSANDVGAVGAKLIYPDGRLQEAGGIIWRDATGNNYGRGNDPNAPSYNYRRDVDYCSGAALLVRAALFRQIGAFSDLYSPAYYEDADLCFSIRSSGYRVVYEPRAEVVHYEGVTSGTSLSSGTKRYQEINRPKFERKWATALRAHFENDPASVTVAARRLHARAGSTILVIDTHVPMEDRDAGSSRLLHILSMFRNSGHHVILFPDNYAALQPYTANLQAMGIEVVHCTDSSPSAQEALARLLPQVDLAWICRPDLFTKYAPLVRRLSGAKLVYDTIDLHFVRARRESELSDSGDGEWKRLEREEVAAARGADATIVVTQLEREVLRERGIENVTVVPTIHEIEFKGERRFEDTSGVLFIGGYNHPPNVDAARWLAEEIMPHVWGEFPDARLTLLGSNPPESVVALQSERVVVTGYVHDVKSYFLASRVFAAPMRFGAGMKGKVGHALSYGLPVVTTPIGAEGFALSSERSCLVAEDSAAFARAICRIYSDPELWRALSRASLEVLVPLGQASVAPQLENLIRELLPRT